MTLFSQPTAGRLSRTDRLILMSGAAVAVLLLGFGGALTDLVQRWLEKEEYSHSFLIVAVTAALLWARRRALVENIGRPSWAGPALVVFAIALHVVGVLSKSFVFSQIGFVVALLGIALGAGGYQLLRAVFIPVMYLLFAVPLPSFVDAALTESLELVSLDLGAFIIGLFGIPVYADGNIIDMGNYQLQVVEACSGLRYLYPLLSLSFLAAYLFQSSLWQRGLVFLSAIPIAIGMNGLRIGLVGISVNTWGNQAADGALHFFEGWVVFLACAGLLIAEVSVLAWCSGSSVFQVFRLPDLSSKTANLAARAPSPGASPILLCLLFLCAGALLVYPLASRADITPPRSRLVDFPSRLGQWEGTPGFLDPDAEKMLNPDDYILSDYRDRYGDLVNLYIAYYASQQNGRGFHSPSDCIPAGGWTITNISPASFPDADSRQSLKRVVIQKDAIKQLVYYWFNEQGTNVANEYEAKLRRLTNAIVQNRTDGALVRLTTPISRDEPEEAADRRLREFMRIAMPKLEGFLPTHSPPERASGRESGLAASP